MCAQLNAASMFRIRRQWPKSAIAVSMTERTTGAKATAAAAVGCRVRARSSVCVRVRETYKDIRVCTRRHVGGVQIERKR